jgi:4-hydroxybenzoate polyprenyltransferase
MAATGTRPVAAAEPPAAPARRRSTALLVLESMRPRQWIKNAFVFAGVIFGGQLSDPGAVAAALAAFGAFCLVSGATYLVNDATDAESDRHNPRTAGRPIARGDLAPSTAILAATISGLAGLGLAAVVNLETLAVVGGYVVLQLAYSAGLKHVLFVDVMVIASGFVLRALAGAVAVEVVVSDWLLLCTALLALFLALAKRRSEALAIGGERAPRRAVLDYYSVNLLDELIAVVTPATLVVYCLYATLGAQTDAMLLTVPFVLYGIFRVLFIIHHRSPEAEEPAVVVIKDRPLLACVVLWGALAAAITLLAG